MRANVATTPWHTNTTSVSISIFVSISGLSSAVSRVKEGKHSELKFDGMEDEGLGEGLCVIEGWRGGVEVFTRRRCQ